MLQAGTEFLTAVGLEKARAVFVTHNDTDHAHIHVVASRIDPETGKTLRVDYDQAERAEMGGGLGRRRTGRSATEGKGIHALQEAVEGRDVDAVLSYLTRDKATFQRGSSTGLCSMAGLRARRATLSATRFRRTRTR